MASAQIDVLKSYRGFLFDMDGTILTSIVAAERVWSLWAQRHGLDVASFLPTIHGVRSTETIAAQNLPGIDPQAEADWITERELTDTDGIAAISGVSEFLRQLPPEAWAIVTSAPRRLALKRIEVAGLPMPEVLVSAEDVSRGKPEPDCFLLGAKKLGLNIQDCLIFEDAPAGITAATASGADVVVVTATHETPPEVPHATIAHYEDLVVQAASDGAWRITCRTDEH